MPNTDEDKPCYEFKVYWANRHVDMQPIMDRIREVIEEVLECPVRATLVDVVTEPERAAIAKVYATPMLVKELPEPVLRVLGDLSDPHKVVAVLSLEKAPKQPL